MRSGQTAQGEQQQPSVTASFFGFLALPLDARISVQVHLMVSWPELMRCKALSAAVCFEMCRMAWEKVEMIWPCQRTLVVLDLAPGMYSIMSDRQPPGAMVSRISFSLFALRPNKLLATVRPIDTDGSKDLVGARLSMIPA
jgi:hypothetical protein